MPTAPASRWHAHQSDTREVWEETPDGERRVASAVSSHDAWRIVQMRDALLRILAASPSSLVGDLAREGLGIPVER